MPTEKESLDYFGQFLMKNYRDKVLKTLEIAMNKQWKVEPLEKFQDFLQTLTQSQRKTLFDGFQKMIDGALYDLLFDLQEENRFTGRIKILVDKNDVVQISEGIHDEQFGKDGWIRKYSSYANNT